MRQGLRHSSLLLGVASLLAAAPVSPSLGLGSPAPAFRVGRWVKGEPVPSLQKGRVYVVECWATWCGPCRESIPHLTELARRYKGRVTFIGVDIWEKGDPKAVDAKVDAFVAAMGDRMDYAVCRDSAERHVTQAWMQASGSRGIPTAFLVDAEGRIAWIGGPHELEPVLERLFSGRYSLEATRKEAAARDAEEKAEEAASTARRRAWQACSPAIHAALKAKDHRRALQLVEAAEAAHPELKPSLQRPRFLALVGLDPAKAEAMLRPDPADAEACLQAALTVLWEEGLEARWYRTALDLLDRAARLDPKTGERGCYGRFRGLLQIDPAAARAAFDAEARRGGSLATWMANEVLRRERLPKGWHAAAVAVLETALKGLDASTRLRVDLAAGYRRLGRETEAQETYRRALAEARAEGAPEAMLKQIEAQLSPRK